MQRSLATLLVFVLLPTSAWCGKVKVWNHHQPAHYDKAELKSVVVGSDGSLRLGRQVRPLDGIAADHVWAVVEDSNRNLFVATGNEGKVFKLTPDGQSSLVYQGGDSQVLCLSVGDDGAIYAGTGPSGLIIRIPTEGEPMVFCKTGESYVWSLTVDAKNGTLIAGTGPHGKLLKIDREGKSSVYFATKQNHVLCVALATDGQVYAGTGKRGLVYRINPQGKGFVLFDAPQTEVRSLLVTKDAVYAGTGSPGGRREPATTAATTGGGAGLLQAAFWKDSGGKEKMQSPNPPSGSGAPVPSGSSSSTSSSTSSAPSASDNSVYRIHNDGAVREVFREKAMMLSLLEHSGRLLIATGADGQVFELMQPGRERSELLRLDHTQVHCLCQRADGSIILGTGDPGKLYVLQDKFVEEGSVTSEVLDAKTLSRWGTVHLKSEKHFATGIQLETRSGNVAEPDDSWSDWLTTTKDSLTGEGLVKSPSARFLQYRMRLSRIPDLAAATTTPVLRGVSIRYQTVNIAPEIEKIEVPDLDVATLENSKKVRLRWSANDVNDDELTYSLAYRKDGWHDWVVLESELEKKEFEWDTTTTPAGVYQVRVTVSDRKDNSEEEALSADRISAPFVVDHVAPDVDVNVVRTETGCAVIEANAADRLTRLVSASFSVDSKKWTNVFPKDGLFDARAKRFRFKTEELKPGTHVIVFRVTDAAGNVGSQDVVFTVPTK
jgi:hypothetical protein